MSRLIKLYYKDELINCETFNTLKIKDFIYDHCPKEITISCNDKKISDNDFVSSLESDYVIAYELTP